MNESIATNEGLIRSFMHAAAALLKQAVIDAREVDADGVAGLNHLLRLGLAELKLSATMAPGSGRAQLDIEVRDQSGLLASLMHLEMERETVN